MERIAIEGGVRLEGEAKVSGSKNATLALMAASLIARGETVLRGVPRVRDIAAMADLLCALGADTRFVQDDYRPGDAVDADRAADGHTLAIRADGISTPEAPYELVRKMRASFMVLGPLVARVGQARVSEPGGCAIGVRPVDQHMKGLAALGAKVKQGHGTVEAAAAPLVGGAFRFDLVSVNGTQNLMMAAALAQGETRIENAAREPEVLELALFLQRMGAEIHGAGSDTITIAGTSGEPLRAVHHEVCGDRIEAGTLLAAAMATRGSVRLCGVDSSHLDSMLAKLGETGAEIDVTADTISLDAPRAARPISVTTAPYPGFPTDMQAQLMAVLALGDPSGVSTVTEAVFENRFMHVPELVRLGADIKLSGNTASVRGVARLEGAPVMATDLRASASLIVAGLAAEGETLVNRVYHIDRGYEQIEQKLRALGARIRREEADAA